MKKISILPGAHSRLALWGILIVACCWTACTKEVNFQEPNQGPITFINPDTSIMALPFSLADRGLLLDVEFQLDLHIDQLWIDYAISADDTLNPFILQPWQHYIFDTLPDSSQRNFYKYIDTFVVPGGLDTTLTVWLNFRVYGWDRIERVYPNGVPYTKNIVRDFNKSLRIDIDQ